MTDRRNLDIVIAGAGAVGALLGHALAMRGFEIAIIDAGSGDQQASVRTSALSRASLRGLSDLGLWPLEGVEAAPLRALRVVDHSGHGRLSFDSADIGEADLGVIVNHGRLESALRAKAQVRGVSWHRDHADGVELGDAHIEVIMKGGGRLRAPLLIAADGAQSVIRERLGVAVLQYRYGQTAVCADIRLEHAHEGVAWQRFLHHGPCALLPLPDADRASLIWSTADYEARRLQDLSDTEFTTALNEAFGDHLGRLEVDGERAYFPLVASHAQHYVGARFALVGDAAHRVHPLAGQGVNLGFADAGALIAALNAGRARSADLGRRRTLRPYERERKADNLAMLAATDLLNRAFRDDRAWVRAALRTGLNITDTLPLFKTLFMRAAGASASRVAYDGHPGP